jgi:hypothetical protein
MSSFKHKTFWVEAFWVEKVHGFMGCKKKAKKFMARLEAKSRAASR